MHGVMAATEEVYHPKDTVSETIKATMVTGAAGLMVSAVQNSLARQNIGAWGVFTRTGSQIAVFGGCSPAHV